MNDGRREPAYLAGRRQGPVLGRRRHRHGDRWRPGLAAVAMPATACPRGHRVGTRVYGTPRQGATGGAFASQPSPTPAPTSPACALSRLRTRRTMKRCQRYQGVDHERGHRSTSTSALPLSTRRPRGVVRRASRCPRYGRVEPGPEVPQARHPGVDTAEVVLADVRGAREPAAAGKEKLDAESWPRPERGTTGEKQRRCRRSRQPRPTVGAQALGNARARRDALE